MKKLMATMFGVMAMVGCASTTKTTKPTLSNAGTAHAQSVPATEVHSSMERPNGMVPDSQKISHPDQAEPEVHYGCH
jgi:hypothetical protein